MRNPCQWKLLVLSCVSVTSHSVSTEDMPLTAASHLETEDHGFHSLRFTSPLSSENIRLFSEQIRRVAVAPQKDALIFRTVPPDSYVTQSS